MGTPGVADLLGSLAGTPEALQHHVRAGSCCRGLGSHWNHSPGPSWWQTRTRSTHLPAAIIPSFSLLVQDVEALVKRLYPWAAEEMIVVQANDFFIDNLHDQQLKIYVKQENPGNLHWQGPQNLRPF